MKRTFSITLAVLALLAAFVAMQYPVQAQLILASGTYRITELDEDKERIGIAQLDANPTVTQNWIYLKLKTKVTKRFSQNGWLRDESVPISEIFNVVEKGDVIKVEGGRDWNGSITAKDIVIMPDNVSE
ncbi:MAG: hypothetical protein K6A35_00685 [bacterium]|nr:hypothetical protein [bacterium]